MQTTGGVPPQIKLVPVYYRYTTTHYSICRLRSYYYSISGIQTFPAHSANSQPRTFCQSTIPPMSSISAAQAQEVVATLPPSILATPMVGENFYQDPIAGRHRLQSYAFSHYSISGLGQGSDVI